MTGLVRKATLMGVCGLLAAATALANVPDAGTSDHVQFIPVVGTNAGVPHPGLAVGGVIRDFAGNPISDAPVELDFSACTDMNLCDAAVAGGGTVACGPSTVTVRTDPAGVWSVTVIGGGAGTPPSIGVGPGGGCVTIRAGAGGSLTPPTVVINTATAWLLNIRSDNTAVENPVNGFDISSYKADQVCAQNGLGAGCPGAAYLGRLDVFSDNAINGFDLSQYKTHWNNGNTAGGQMSASGCPNVYCP
jgi:hypothetical protein